MKQKKSNRTIPLKAVVFNIMILILIFITAFLTLVEHWAFTTWSNLKLEEIIYQLTNPIEGTAGDIMHTFYLKVLLPASVITLAAGIVFLWLLPKKISPRKLHRNLILIISCLTFISFTVINGWQTLDIGGYIRSHSTNSDYIEQNYADPAATTITFPQVKRNLIYIFLESMETTFSDKSNGGAFDQNYIPELTNLAQQNEDFSGDSNLLDGGYALNGTTWTIGAMFGQTSGLPLKLEVDSNSYSFKHFFPNMTAIGDILEKEGYNQTLIVGSDIRFASRDVYFTDHGHYKLEDYYSLMADGRIPQGYKVWWGFEDKKLFALAKEDLTSLSSSGQPFNYTMLTVDTHFPDGYVCDLCREDFGSNQYANVIACSSRQVAEFVHWVQQQDWYANTTIVISGDHPTMDGDFCSNISSDYNRKVYTCYINAAASPIDPHRRRRYSTMDNFPTTLAALGAEIAGNRLGLGTNLFSTEDTLLEKDGISKEDSELARNSDFMQKLSAIDENDLKESQSLHNVSVTYDTRLKGDGTIAITARGLAGVRKYIQSLSIHVYNRNDSNQVIYLDASDNSDGTYTAVFDPHSGQLPEDEAYNFQAYVWTSVGEIGLGSMQTFWPDSMSTLNEISEKLQS